MPGTVAAAVSKYGASLKPKFSGAAISGAPEDQLRNPLETLIKDLGEILGRPANSIDFVGETTLIELNSRPDFAVTVSNALVGFIEVKAPKKGANPRNFTDPHDKAQWGRLKTLPNILYTNGNSFTLWQDGEQQGRIVDLDGDVETSGTKLKAPDTLLPMIESFLTWNPQPPKSAKKLAQISARLCRLLRDEVAEQMALGSEGLTALAKDWRKLLFPEASDGAFADGYAQAVTFGLLVARARDIPLKGGIDLAARELRKTNSLIGTALDLLTDDVSNQESLKTSLGTLTRVLNEVAWADIAKDEADAWLYFYEDFLEVYDNTLRKKTGSYYTPPEVVAAMVRLVDECLRGPLFERAAGLASPDVVIADPAVGTGTFLLGVLRRIAATVREDQGPGAVHGAIAAAAKRVIGFELQFGPFAVAQLRLIAEMQALMKTPALPLPPIPDLQLFITDTLGNPFVEDETLGRVYEPIAKSRREANKIKKSQPITVCIGNPPYKNQAAGRGSWIEEGSRGRAAAMDWWSPPAAWQLSAYTHHLKNLYVYFWRWATLKVFGSGWHAATGEPELDRHGIVCFITAAGFLNGDAFQKMRESLRRDASEIWVVDCSPDGHQPDIPTRIFADVQQSICIVLAARAPGKYRQIPASIHFTSLPRGRAREKLDALAALSLDGGAWRVGEPGWRSPLLPEQGADWTSYPKLSELMIWSSPGVKAHRTWIISPDAASLAARWEVLKGTKDLRTKQVLFHEDRDRTLQKIVAVSLGNIPSRAKSVAADNDAVIEPVRFALRSFDRQWLIPDHRLVSMARPALWSIWSRQQVYLTGLEAHSPKNGPAVTFTALIPDNDHYKGSFAGRAYPLWRDARADQPNVTPALLSFLADVNGCDVTPADMLAYVAALLAHPSFTARFKADLLQPGLRVPLTANAALFAEAITLGREVIWLYCYGERFADPAADRPKRAPRLPGGERPRVPEGGDIPGAPEPLPDVMTYDPGKQELRIGTGTVANVTPAMWAYEVSGRNVLRSWFSYRRRDRTKPIIGDRRPPSPLDAIQPDHWPAEYTSDLIDLLNVLGRLIKLEPAQAELLDRICAGKLITVQALHDAGVISPRPGEDAA